MKKVDIILFTYNRAMQCDLALRSIRQNFANVGKVIVFYKYNTSDFKQGYFKIFAKKYDLDLSFAYQYRFGEDFKNIFRDLKADWYMGFCDDDCFVKYTNCDNILDRFNQLDISGISLKVHANQTFSYPGINTPLPKWIEENPYLKWNWRNYPKQDVDFGYPTNINAMIYERKYFWNIIMTNQFNCPNSMEGSLNAVRYKFRDCLISFRETKVLNIAANVVQTNNSNPKINKIQTTEELNKRFLNGEIISTENIYGYKGMFTRTELEYKFTKE